MDTEKKFFYANSLEVAVSPYDFSLKFSRQGPPENIKSGEPPKPNKLDEFTVSMSPVHAKAMLAGLYRAVGEYEKNVGQIVLPKHQETEYQQTFAKLLGK